ncbi:ABC transporter permease [Candidatus Riflebacteria bacterium]
MSLWEFYKRELRRLFFSLTLLFLIPAFILINGIQFNVLVNLYSRRSMTAKTVKSSEKFLLNCTDSILRPFFGNMSIILMFFVPLFCMKSFASEKANGELALIQSYPVSDFSIFGGKFLAYFSVFILILSFSLTYCFVLKKLLPFSVKILGFSIVGMLLLGAFYIAICLFASSLTENTIISALISFCLIFLFWISSFPAYLLGENFRIFCEHISPIMHLDYFLQGIIQSKDILYFLNMSLFFSILTLFSLGNKHWMQND